MHGRRAAYSRLDLNVVVHGSAYAAIPSTSIRRQTPVGNNRLGAGTGRATGARGTEPINTTACDWLRPRARGSTRTVPEFPFPRSPPGQLCVCARLTSEEIGGPTARPHSPREQIKPHPLIPGLSLAVASLSRASFVAPMWRDGVKVLRGSIRERKVIELHSLSELHNM